MADDECSFKATISTQEEEALSRGNDGVCARFGTGGGAAYKRQVKHCLCSRKGITQVGPDWASRPRRVGPE
jgi:hypothetical protein